jgi:hypothetical protein
MNKVLYLKKKNKIDELYTEELLTTINENNLCEVSSLIKEFIAKINQIMTRNATSNFKHLFNVLNKSQINFGTDVLGESFKRSCYILLNESYIKEDSHTYLLLTELIFSLNESIRANNINKIFEQVNYLYQLQKGFNLTFYEK